MLFTWPHSCIEDADCYFLTALLERCALDVVVFLEGLLWAQRPDTTLPYALPQKL